MINRCHSFCEKFFPPNVNPDFLYCHLKCYEFNPFDQYRLVTGSLTAVAGVALIFIAKQNYEKAKLLREINSYSDISSNAFKDQIENIYLITGLSTIFAVASLSYSVFNFSYLI